jgi:DNA polymerase III delta prime subunit
MTLVGNVQLVSGTAETVGQVLKILERSGVSLKKNPDLYTRIYMHFGADEARELRTRASMRAIGDRRVFIVVAASMTIEAQNILLKTIEEPSGDALFIFIVPSPEALLPTVRSRAQILKVEDNSIHEEAGARKFLSGDTVVRLELLKPLLEKGDDDRRDIGSLITLLSSLERIVGNVKDAQVKRSGLRSIYLARKYITDKGALAKTLLEQVALIVPRV